MRDVEEEEDRGEEVDEAEYVEGGEEEEEEVGVEETEYIMRKVFQSGQ